MEWIAGALRTASEPSFPLLLGAVGGGVAGTVVAPFTWWFEVRATTLRQLLVQALDISRLREAYIPEARHLGLGEQSPLSTATGSLRA